MFSVGAWNVRSSCPVVDAPATCSTSMGLLQWSCGHRSCCGSVGRCTSWRRQNAADITSSCLFTLLIVLCLFVFWSASLVPVFSFGENDLFYQADNPAGSSLRHFQESFKNIFGVAPPLFYGRGIFNYTFGFIPFRKPINTIGSFTLFICVMASDVRLWK